MALTEQIREAVARGATEALVDLTEGDTYTHLVETATDNIIESIYPDTSSGTADRGSGQGRPTKSDTIRHKGQIYNAHTSAAHRSSVAAFTSGDHASHSVAAIHHKHAAEAATDAANSHPEGSPTRKDYETAAAYHTAQSKAHTAATATSMRGNTAGSGGYYPSY